MSCILFSWLRGEVSGARSYSTAGREARARILAIEFVCFLSFFLSFLFLFLPTFSIFSPLPLLLLY